MNYANLLTFVLRTNAYANHAPMPTNLPTFVDIAYLHRELVKREYAMVVKSNDYQPVSLMVTRDRGCTVFKAEFVCVTDRVRVRLAGRVLDVTGKLFLYEGAVRHRSTAATVILTTNNRADMSPVFDHDVSGEIDKFNLLALLSAADLIKESASFADIHPNGKTRLGVLAAALSHTASENR